MPTLVFLPNPRLAWISRLPDADQGLPLEDLARRINAGEWQMPARWLDWLGRHFRLPQPLALRAYVQLDLLVMAPYPPLTEKRPGAARALNPPLALKPVQRLILLRLACGLSIEEIAGQLGHTPRWVKYQVRAVRQARTAYLQAERKAER